MPEPYKYLDEDLKDGDVTSNAVVPGNANAVANIIAKEDCTLAGSEEATRIFEHEGLQLKHFAKDGDRLMAGTIIMEISGDARAILKGERLALNFIQRMSGIATVTAELVGKCKPINPNVRVAATRKTTPGFRAYEKRAVELGGGERHREGLYDMVLVKDNHLKFCESITEAIRRVKESGYEGQIEVEVVDGEGAEEAAKAGAHIIMLDNMAPEEAKRASSVVKGINNAIIIEISGGITPRNISDYAEFADRISLGWLTHSVMAKDFSLEIVETS